MKNYKVVSIAYNGWRPIEAVLASGYAADEGFFETMERYIG